MGRSESEGGEHRVVRAGGGGWVPETCGPQGMVLHGCSLSGLEEASQARLGRLSTVRQRTSLVWEPLPHEREH